MISVRNVTKKFENFTAIEDITFDVADSSIYGLVGYNGAGKTTLLKTAAGIYKPDSGQVLLDGTDVYDNASARGNLVFIPDEFMVPRGATPNTMKALYKGYFKDFSDKIFDHMILAMGLDKKERIASFSKGMQKQVQIACALATRPKYMLVDEIFDGIDPQKRNLCKKILIEYIADTQCSIIISSHNLNEVNDLCDHVALINGKKLALNVSVDDVGRKYKKYHMIFKEPVSEQDFQHVKYKSFTNEGKIITIVVENDNTSKQLLKSLNPVHMDSIALSLEEVFLNEMEDEKYDISSIFSE